jgi:hypothetical protein
MKTTSIRFTDEEEAALNRLAKSYGCFSRYGKTSGEPSWRVMFQLVASGRLHLVDPLKKKVFLNFKKPPGWWRPDGEGSMLVTEVKKHCKKWTIEELETAGMEIDGDRITAPWKAWKNPGETKIPPCPGPPPPWWVDQGGRAMRIEDTGMELEELLAIGLVDMNDGRVAALWPEWGGAK